ncbi:peptidase [Streptomyces sp. MMG1121]|nr:peptidase [Streptomyces sp. MMG1121]
MTLLGGGFSTDDDGEPGRRSSYRAAVATGALSAGWALEDGVGALFVDGSLSDAVTRVPQARLYRVEPGDGGGGTEERALPCRALVAAQ